MVVIVPSGEFFTKNKEQKKLGLTSTYKYKTIHTSVWMLLREGGEKTGVNPFRVRLSSRHESLLRPNKSWSGGESAPPGGKCKERGGKMWAGRRSWGGRGFRRTRRVPLTGPLWAWRRGTSPCPCSRSRSSGAAVRRRRWT